jgi:hypothetical protein
VPLGGKLGGSEFVPVNLVNLHPRPSLVSTVCSLWCNEFDKLWDFK